MLNLTENIEAPSTEKSSQEIWDSIFLDAPMEHTSVNKEYFFPEQRQALRIYTEYENLSDENVNRIITERATSWLDEWLSSNEGAKPSDTKFIEFQFTKNVDSLLKTLQDLENNVLEKIDLAAIKQLHTKSFIKSVAKLSKFRRFSRYLKSHDGESYVGRVYTRRLEKLKRSRFKCLPSALLTGSLQPECFIQQIRKMIPTADGKEDSEKFKNRGYRSFFKFFGVSNNAHQCNRRREAFCY